MKRIAEDADFDGSVAAVLREISRRDLSRRQLLQIAATGAILGTLQACNFGSQSSNKSNVSHALKVGTDGAVPAIDWEANVAGGATTASIAIECNLYDRLVVYSLGPGPDGTTNANPTKMVGQLAESWSVSADGRTWTFKLRQGVKSHFGNELTAQDVVWTHQRGVAAKKVYTFLNNVVGLPADGVKAVDRYTVTFTTNQPAEIFLATRALTYAGIFDSTEATKHATSTDPAAVSFLSQNACGFGPYKVTSWVQNQSITLQARSDYYGARPFVQTVNYETIPDSANRLAQLLRGDLDLSEHPAIDEALLAKTSSGTKLISLPAARPAWIRLNHTRPPFNDVRVRQAMATAMPYGTIVKDIFKNLAKQSRSVVPETIPGSDASGWNYNTDVAKARSLLTSAIGSGSLDVSLMTPATSNDMQEVAVAMRTAMAPAGFNITIDQQPAANFVARVAKNDFQAVLINTQTPIIGDPYYVFALYFTTTSLTNSGHFSNKDVDSLVAQAGGELDLTKRQALLKQAQLIAIQQVAAIPILNQNLNIIMRNDLNGYENDPDTAMRFWSLRR